jgi:hypothetical protein
MVNTEDEEGAKRPPFHRITNVDPDTKIGDCSVCGRTPVYWRKDKRHWICQNKKRQWSGQKNYRTEGFIYVSVAEYEALVSAQNGLCATCGNPMLSPRLDHDHYAKAARGLLCNRCNVVLGMVDDDISLLAAMVIYLDKSRRRQNED